MLTKKNFNLILETCLFILMIANSVVQGKSMDCQRGNGLEKHEVQGVTQNYNIVFVWILNVIYKFVSQFVFEKKHTVREFFSKYNTNLSIH